jgi:hypothetical protein
MALQCAHIIGSAGYAETEQRVAVVSRAIKKRWLRLMLGNRRSKLPCAFPFILGLGLLLALIHLLPHLSILSISSL